MDAADGRVDRRGQADGGILVGHGTTYKLYAAE